MAPQALTEYERRRLENIERNKEMIASLKRKAEDLSATVKATRTKPLRSPTKASPQQKAPAVLRRSLRTRGIPPDPASRLPPEPPSPVSPETSPAKKKGPIPLGEVLVGELPLNRHLVGAISDMGHHARLRSREEGGTGRIRSESWDPAVEMTLEPADVKRFLPGRILTVRFFPSEERIVVAAGDKFGHLGFWDADYVGSEGNGTNVYAPHSSPVSGISIHPFALSKIFTCSYDGFIRLMDVEEETFSMLYFSDECIFSISQQQNDAKSIYFGEGSGELKVWDVRAGKISHSWVLHDQRINTIDFTVANTNLMATSSTDGVACIWDLRMVHVEKPEVVKSVRHARAVHSAFFSPSGSSLATTSFDDSVGILSGPNFDSLAMIKHYNQTGRWISSFRAIWGWDDTYLFLGNMKRAVDIISAVDKTTDSLQSLHMTAIPCRFDAHPYRTGLLAGATAGGQVYVWRRS